MMQPLSKPLRAIFLGIALIATMLACVSYLLLNEIRRPVGEGSAPVAFTIEQGESTSAIATSLAENKLIRFPLLFTALVRSKGLDGALKAGTYNLRPNMTMSEIISALQLAPQLEDISITIIEGTRLEEIADQINSAGFTAVNGDDFLKAARDGAAFKSRHFLLNDLPQGASLEGYLFPDTYRFAKTAQADTIINTMLDNFDQKYATFETAVRVERNVHEIVTMASVVQREAVIADEMPKISAVFWNRLKPENAAETGNGRLQADPTLQYALGAPGDWWPNLSNLTLDQINGNTSPYNTRVQPGLPPGPISNPGLDALAAAAQPDDSEPLLYFVAACDRPGAHNFATSFEQFQQLEAQYQSCQP